MKICFITTGDIWKIATSKRALGMANHLHNLGWQVSIIMEDTNENHHRVSLECLDAIHVCYYPTLPALKEVRIKNKILKEINPDCIYICAFVFRNIVNVKSHCIKLVEHSELASQIRPYRLRNLKSLILEYYSIIYSSGLINASKYLQEIFIRRNRHLAFCRLRPMLYCPYAYSAQICLTNADTKHLPITKNKNDRFFVFLGSLAENYGVFTMIKAFQIVHKHIPNLHLVLLGKGPDFSRVVKYVKNYNLQEYIHIQGFVKEEDIPAYFRLADAFISPMNNTIQDWARCPSKLYMYLPYQKPIITCKIGEPYEVLKDKGFYYQPGSEISLAQTIMSFNPEDEWHLNINPLEYEWKTRTFEFYQWFITHFANSINYK